MEPYDIDNHSIQEDFMRDVLWSQVYVYILDTSGALEISSEIFFLVFIVQMQKPDSILGG